jgi:hypothetical protein
VRRARDKLHGKGLLPNLPEPHIQALDLLHEQTRQVRGGRGPLGWHAPGPGAVD